MAISNALHEMLKVIGSLNPPGCYSCHNKTLAFGVRVCGIGKPEPKPGCECPFWKK